MASIFDSDNDDGGFDWKEALTKFGLSYASNKLLGGRTTEERNLGRAATAPYEETERYLPPALRSASIGPTLQSGISGIGELIRNPGGLNPAVADAIRARLAAESGNIAQSYRGIASNQAGAAARGNLPVSIKGALQSALDIAQERAQRGARQEALGESEALRREDLNRTFAILDAILQFMQSGRGGAITGLGQAASFAQNRQASNLAGIGSLLESLTGQRQQQGGTA